MGKPTADPRPVEPPVVAAPTPEALVKARIELARQTYAEVEQAILDPPAGVSANISSSFYLDQLTLWSLRWMEAERDLDGGKAARTTALKAHIARLTTLEEMVVESIEGEQFGLTPKSLATVKFHRLQAQYWLARDQP